MRKSQIVRARKLHAKGYSVEQVALAMAVPVAKVEAALVDGRKTSNASMATGPDTIIDGERLEDRVKRLKAKISADYYIVVPEGLK